MSECCVSEYAENMMMESVVYLFKSREGGISSYTTLVVHVTTHVYVSIHPPIQSPARK